MSRATTQKNEPSESVAVPVSEACQAVMGSERRLAAEHSLLSAAADVALARLQWHESGIALLRCGGIFAAIRMNAALLTAAVGTDDLRKVDAYLAEALRGGPVSMDQELHRYYALVPVSTGRRPEWKNRVFVDVEFLGCGNYIGVPPLTFTTPERRRYWCVRMGVAGDLVAPHAVTHLVHTARSKIANQCHGD